MNSQHLYYRMKTENDFSASLGVPIPRQAMPQAPLLVFSASPSVPTARKALHNHPI